MPAYDEEDYQKSFSWKTWKRLGPFLKPFRRAFLLAGACHEAVREDVILRRREALDGAIAAMVVGKDKAVGTHHDARTIVAEINHAVLEAGVSGAVELVGRELKAEAAHGFGCLVVDTVQHPHAFVGMGK